MFRFSDIDLEDLPGQFRRKRPLKRLTKPVTVHLGDFLLTTIEAGFVTDGSSQPWLLRWKWGSWGRYTPAAILHDWLLERTTTPKWQADWLFMGALRDSRVSALEAGIFWLAVRTKRSRN